MASELLKSLVLKDVFFVCKRMGARFRAVKQVKETFLCLIFGFKGQFQKIPNSKSLVRIEELHKIFRGDVMEIGFIGAGKVGKALGLYFKSHGLTLSGYYSRTVKSAQEAAALTETREFSSVKELSESSNIIFLSVPDDVLEEMDNEISNLVNTHRISTEKIWIHVSGAHPSDYLEKIKAAGCTVGSMHPLQSFGTPDSSVLRLERTWFTVEGMEKAVSAIKEILEKTGAKYTLIEAENKPLYHAGACVVSNFLTTLMESGIKLFEAAGMERESIIQAIWPLIDATQANIREKGAIEALTGPIVRSDFGTVRVHLQALKAFMPEELEFYTAMARKTTQMLKNKRLTSEQVNKFEKILEEV
jgi:predicted short-subunit dehydrogenase-like oxidoreductase (DUF2520 family)